jgi:hypothetical protein
MDFTVDVTKSAGAYIGVLGPENCGTGAENIEPDDDAVENSIAA